MDQTVLEPEPRVWSRSQKFWMSGAGAGARNLNFSSKALVPLPTTAILSTDFSSASFLKQVAMQIGQLKSYGVSTRLCSCQDDCGIYYACAVRG